MNPFLTLFAAWGLAVASTAAAQGATDAVTRGGAVNAIAMQQKKKSAPLPGGNDGREAEAPPTKFFRPEESEPSFEIDEKVIKSVERGLKWLAEQQLPNGSWKASVGFKLNETYQIDPDVADRGDVGVTALCGMAFLANGQAPGRGKYSSVVDKTLDYVLSCQQSNGYITANGSRMYSHAFSTLFLAEILGMVKRDDVREKLEDAIRLIIDSQNKEGGWRYVPFATESDMSITVCQVMALRAARNVGIPVPRATIDRAIQYVKDSAVREGGIGGGARGAFRYQKQNHSRETFPLTAAGIVTLNGAGIYSDRDIDLGLDFLEREMDGFSREYGDSYFRNRSGHYFFYYGHYYAVQAMYTAGGERWKNYYTRIRSILLKMQLPDGSWPNEVGPGVVFGTAVGTLILQIPYRYLPIFQR